MRQEGKEGKGRENKRKEENRRDFYLIFLISSSVPERPSSLSISEIKSHSLRVTWVRPSPPEFLIKHYLLEVWSAVSSSWQSLNSSIEEKFYDVTQLIPFTTYMFRVKAANGLGTSKIWRTSENVTTLSYSKLISIFELIFPHKKIRGRNKIIVYILYFTVFVSL